MDIHLYFSLCTERKYFLEKPSRIFEILEGFLIKVEQYLKKQKIRTEL